MNRQEFMKRLEELLCEIPVNEREDALAYYNDYFDEAGIENEQQVIQELGSPEAVAENIIANVQRDTTQRTRNDYTSPEPEKNNYEKQTSSNSPMEKQGMSKSTKILLVVVLILTFPLWIGIVAGLFGGLIGIIGALFGIVIGLIGTAFGLAMGGVGCLIVGIGYCMTNPVEGLAVIAVGAILAAVGILLALLCVWSIGVWIPKGVKALVGWIKGLFHRNKGGNEI